MQIEKAEGRDKSLSTISPCSCSKADAAVTVVFALHSICVSSFCAFGRKWWVDSGSDTVKAWKLTVHSLRFRVARSWRIRDAKFNGCQRISSQLRSSKSQGESAKGPEMKRYQRRTTFNTRVG
jgi:hypothetical protein